MVGARENCQKILPIQKLTAAIDAYANMCLCISFHSRSVHQIEICQSWGGKEAKITNPLNITPANASCNIKIKLRNKSIYGNILLTLWKHFMDLLRFASSRDYTHKLVSALFEEQCASSQRCAWHKPGLKNRRTSLKETCNYTLLVTIQHDYAAPTT